MVVAAKIANTGAPDKTGALRVLYGLPHGVMVSLIARCRVDDPVTQRQCPRKWRSTIAWSMISWSDTRGMALRQNVIGSGAVSAGCFSAISATTTATLGWPSRCLQVVVSLAVRCHLVIRRSRTVARHLGPDQLVRVREVGDVESRDQWIRHIDTIPPSATNHSPTHRTPQPICGS